VRARGFTRQADLPARPPCWLAPAKTAPRRPSGHKRRPAPVDLHPQHHHEQRHDHAGHEQRQRLGAPQQADKHEQRKAVLRGGWWGGAGVGKGRQGARGSKVWWRCKGRAKGGERGLRVGQRPKTPLAPSPRHTPAPPDLLLRLALENGDDHEGAKRERRKRERERLPVALQPGLVAGLVGDAVRLLGGGCRGGKAAGRMMRARRRAVRTGGGAASVTSPVRVAHGRQPRAPLPPGRRTCITTAPVRRSIATMSRHTVLRSKPTSSRSSLRSSRSALSILPWGVLLGVGGRVGMRVEEGRERGGMGWGGVGWVGGGL
jgi:hypothetical protein